MEMIKQIVMSIAACSLLAVVAVAQPPQYSVTDLGPMGPFGQPFAITNNGLISEGVELPSGTFHAFLWYRGLATDISSSGFGGPNSVAIGANNRAQVIGQAETSDTDPYGEDFCGYGTHLVCLPFLWQFGLMTPLPTLGGRNGNANMINSRGQVAGYAENATMDPACPAPQKYQFEPVLWTNGSAQGLPTASGDLEGLAWALNDNGQVTGASGACSVYNPNLANYLLALHALFWDKGTVTVIPSLGGTGHGFGNFSKNLNNLGQVVGFSDMPGDQTSHAFLWSKEAGTR